MLKYLSTSAAIAILLTATPAYTESENPVPGTPADAAGAVERSPSSGDTKAAPAERVSTIMPGQLSGQYSAGDLVGTAVLDADGREVGRVEDLVISRQGSVEGIVVAVGGVMGIGAKGVGVSWSTVEVGSDGKIVLRETSREELEEAPAFDRPARENT